MLTNSPPSAPTASGFIHPAGHEHDSGDDSASSSSIDDRCMHTSSHARSLSTVWAKKPSIKPERHQKKPSIDASEHDILKTKLEILSITLSSEKDEIEKSVHDARKSDSVDDKEHDTFIDHTSSPIKDVDQLSQSKFSTIPRRKTSNARSLHHQIESTAQSPEISRHMRSLTLHAPPLESKPDIQLGTSTNGKTLADRVPISNNYNHHLNTTQRPTFQHYHAPPHHQFHRVHRPTAYYPYHYYARNAAPPIRDTATPPFVTARDSTSTSSIPVAPKEHTQYIDHRYPMPWLWGTPMHQYPSHVTYPVPHPTNNKSEVPGCNKISNDNTNVDNIFPLPVWMMSAYGRYDHVDDVILSDTDAYESDLHQILTGVCQPLPEERKLHDELYSVIHSLLIKHFPSASLKRFGSTENGFSLRGADLDFCVITPSKAMLLSNEPGALKASHTIEDPAQFISLFGEKLRLDSRFSANIKILSRARVPIIKLKDSVTGLSCDIGVNNVLALYNTKLLKVYGEICHKESPIVVQLALLVKFWAKQRELNDPYWGTLSSYCYLMMVIYYLQQRSPPLLPILQNIPSANTTGTCTNSIDDIGNEVINVHIDGCTVRFISDPTYLWPELASINGQNSEIVTLTSLLEGFFHFYAHDFSYANHVISIRTRSLITKEMKQWTLEQNSIKGSFWFCVEDPFDIDQNLARTVSRNSLFHLRGQFIRASKLISKRVPFGRICSPYYP